MKALSASAGLLALAALAAVSEDYGRTWTPARPSNLPMATSKPCAGLLSTGQRFLVCSTSADGVTVEDVTVHHAGGMGVIAEDCANPALRRFRVARKPGARSLMTTTADADYYVLTAERPLAGVYKSNSSIENLDTRPAAKLRACEGAVFRDNRSSRPFRIESDRPDAFVIEPTPTQP